MDEKKRGGWHRRGETHCHMEDGEGFREIAEVVGMSAGWVDVTFMKIMVKFAKAFYPDAGRATWKRLSRSLMFQQAVRDLCEEAWARKEGAKTAAGPKVSNPEACKLGRNTT